MQPKQNNHIISSFSGAVLQKIDKQPVLILWLVYFMMVIATALGMLTLLHYPTSILLVDDGYYRIGNGFINGTENLLHNYRYPGLPLLYSVFCFAPDYLHPYLRLFLATLLFAINLLIARKIIGPHVTNRMFFFGGLFAILHPGSIHWTIKSTPELYITCVLGLIIVFFRNYAQEGKALTLVGLAASLMAGILIKPVFLMIPPVLLVYYAIRKNRKLVLASAIILFTTIAFFLVFQRLTAPIATPKEKATYGVGDLLATTYLLPAYQQTGNVYFGSQPELMKNSPEKSNYATVRKMFREWREQYFLSNPEASEKQFVLDFIKANFWGLLLSKVISPLWFFTLGSTAGEMVLNTCISILILTLSVLQIRKWYFSNPESYNQLVVIFLGFALIYFITFSYARYSYPILFFLSFYSGIWITSALGTKSTVFNKTLSGHIT